MKQFSCNTLAAQIARCASVKVLCAFTAALFLSYATGFAQSDHFVRITSIDSTVEGQVVNTPVGSNALYQTDLNERVTVNFDHRTPLASVVQLLEDGVVVDEVNVFTGFSTSSQLSYVPSAAGASLLAVVFPSVEGADGEENLGDSILLRKIGISINTPSPNELVQAGSRFFVEGSAFLPDSYVRNLSFYVRAAPGLLRENMPYLEGDKIIYQDRIYEVVNDGQLTTGSIAASPGLNSQDRSNVTTISDVGFRYAGPNLVDGLDYHEGDFVLSNNKLYRVATAGQLATGAAAAGLNSSLDPNQSDDVAGVEFLNGQVGFQYNSSPSQLATGQTLQIGDFVYSGSRLYEVLSAGVVTSSPALLEGTDPSITVLLDGIEFRYRNTKQFRSNAPYFDGELVVSGDHIFEVVVAGTIADGASAEGLVAVSSVQYVAGRVGFEYVADEVEAGDPEFFPRQYHKYTRIGEDNASPFTTLWGPADIIADDRNWFGPNGYFEESTTIELFALVTDSKDFGRRSAFVPIRLLPAIDPGAITEVEIIDPLDGRAIAANTTIQISAQAKNAGEVVRGVQFYVNGVPLDVTDSVFPYTINWTANRAGNYVLNAVATDELGNRTTSPDVRVSVTDNRPFVELRSPVSTSLDDPDLIRSGDAFTLSAFAVGSGGGLSRIESVSFFSDGNLIGIGSFDEASNLWTFDHVFGASVNFEPDQVYTISARATDINLLTAQSMPEFVRVSATTGSAPEVALRVTGDSTSVAIGEVIALEITADDAAPGFISKVEILNGEALLGEASWLGGDQYRFALDTATAGIAVGSVNLSARATDNDGNVADATLSVDLQPRAFAVAFTAPTSDWMTLDSDSYLAGTYTFEVEVAGVDATAVQSITWLVDGVEVTRTTNDGAGSLRYSQAISLTQSGTVKAVATHSSGAEVSAEIEVELTLANPAADDSDFVNDLYQRLFGEAATAEQQEAALEFLDGTPDSRVAYLEALFASNAIDESRMVMMVYRSMTGEWPDANELAVGRTALLGGTVASSVEYGSIEEQQVQTFEFSFVAGDTVKVLADSDPSNGNPLRDPALTIIAPSGAQVAYDDDSGLGLNALVDFTASETGIYSVIVSAWSWFDSGDFKMTMISSNSGGTDSVSAEALVQSLAPEFEARFGLAFPTTNVVGAAQTTNLVQQLFNNKHGISVDSLNATRLTNALSGTENTVFGSVIPGYAGALTGFAAAFALDNELTDYLGTLYSSVLHYSMPNYPADELPLALLLVQLLGTEPTDAALADYAGMSQAEAFAAVLSLYEQQFAQAPSTWQPQGWLYYAWPYAYSLSEERWYFFNQSDTQWRVDLSSGEWGTLANATGWHYYAWPYAYSADQSTWHWYNADTQWVVNLLTGEWALFGD